MSRITIRTLRIYDRPMVEPPAPKRVPHEVRWALVCLRRYARDEGLTLPELLRL